MYVWLWKRLPGPWPVKVLQCLVLLVISVLLLFTVVFPWVEPRLPFTDVTVDDEGTSESDEGSGGTVGAPFVVRVAPVAHERLTV